MLDLCHIQQQFTALSLRDRPSQRDMIQQAYDAIHDKKLVCIEAPTGTGKTLGYLLAAHYARGSKQNIIVSTATIALQEQLVKKDLPLLESVLNKNIRYTLAKGRQNYLCLAKLYENDASATQDIFSDDYLSVLKKEVEKPHWDGDKENVSKMIKESDWKTVTTDTAGCSGRQCAYYERCFFFKARNRMYTADFVVTSHSLLLSDLELGGGVLLPEIENNIYIIDECHHLPERSIAHFSKSSALLSSIEWLNQISFTVQRAVTAKVLGAGMPAKINHILPLLVHAMRELKTQLDVNQSLFQDHIWRIVPADLIQFEVVKEIMAHGLELSQQLEQITTGFEESLQHSAEVCDEEKKQLLKKYSMQFKFLSGRMKHFHATWALFCQIQRPGEAPIARWFQQIVLHGNIDYICHCSPIHVGRELQTLFWDKLVNGAVLCSATIRSLGSFANFLRKIGLTVCDRVSTGVIPPIFNYQRCIIFVPRMQYAPVGDQQAAHRKEVMMLLPQLILPQSGTLILFTSHSAMNETYEQLPADIASDVLVQGDHNKLKLIASHKKKIDAEKRSIIFGLTSFAEGIDLPAEYCQHVIIHKLPFAVPSDPVEQTRSEWLTQHQKNPFMLSTLPDAAIKLTQYVGRLIRQEEDIGVVTILDCRIYTKSYGQALLASLPPFTRMIDSTVEQLRSHAAVSALFGRLPKYTI